MHYSTQLADIWFI